MIRLTFILLAGAFAFSSCSAPQSGSVITFTRTNPSEQPVSVTLRWIPNPTKYYTPRGQMSEIIILDGADSVSLPHEVIDDIQDVWPERVQLASPSPGSYELRIPSGVGEGSLDVYRIENFHFAKRISYTTNDYPELTKKDEQAVSGNRR